MICRCRYKGDISQVLDVCRARVVFECAEGMSGFVSNLLAANATGTGKRACAAGCCGGAGAVRLVRVHNGLREVVNTGKRVPLPPVCALSPNLRDICEPVFLFTISWLFI